jgi:hypothetical protein
MFSLDKVILLGTILGATTFSIMAFSIMFRYDTSPFHSMEPVLTVNMIQEHYNKAV